MTPVRMAHIKDIRDKLFWKRSDKTGILTPFKNVV